MFLCQNHTNVLCVWYVCPVYHLTPYVPPTSHPMYDPPHSLWTASHFVYHLTPCVLPHTLCTTSLLVYRLTPYGPPHFLWTASLLVDRLMLCVDQPSPMLSCHACCPPPPCQVAMGSECLTQGALNQATQMGSVTLSCIKRFTLPFIIVTNNSRHLKSPIKSESRGQRIE